MQETSQNIDTLNRRIKDLEKANLDLNIKNEKSLNKQETLAKQVSELSNRNDLDSAKKANDELTRVRDRLEKAETTKVMIDKKLAKVEKELKEY